MNINFRKFLCNFARRGTWLYRICDCKRYEPVPSPQPPEPEYITVKVCLASGKLAGNYCPISDIVKKKYEKGHEPTDACNVHKKPHVEPKLSDEFSYTKVKRAFQAFFPLDALTNHREFTEEDFEGFIDRVAENNLSNVLRFMPNSVWRPYNMTSKVLIPPHPLKNGKYDIETINQPWKDMVFKRLEYVIKRGIMPQVDYIDNCSFHTPDPWKQMWLYRTRNHGFFGEPTHWIPDVKVHFYEWQYLEPMWTEDKGYESEDEMTPEDHDDMLACRTTRKYFEWFYNWFIYELKKEFGNKFMVGHNEVTGGDGYHNWLLEHVYSRHEIPKIQRVTSVDFADWYRKKQSLRRFTISVHGISNLSDYRTAKRDELPPGYSVISGDGDVWKPNDAALRKLCKAVFGDNRGIERNDWLWTQPKFDKLDWDGAEVIRDEYIAAYIRG